MNTPRENKLADVAGIWASEVDESYTYECGDIYEHSRGDTLYCVSKSGHEGKHFGKPAGDRNPNAEWDDDNPRRRANRDPAPRLAGGAPAPPSG